MKNLHESVPKHCIGSPFSARSILMCSDYGGINDRAHLIDLKPQGLEDLLPNPPLGPVRESVVDALPRPESLRKVSPRNPRPRAIEHGVDELPVTQPRAGARPMIRKDEPELGPLFVGKSVSVHRKL